MVKFQIGMRDSVRTLARFFFIRDSKLTAAKVTLKMKVIMFSII